MTQENKLQKLLRSGAEAPAKGTPVLKAWPAPAPAPRAEHVESPAPPAVPELGDPLARIAEISVEAVVGGCLQRIRFKPGTNPADVGAILRGCDPAAKVRDDFPHRNYGGARATKLARVLVVNVRVTDAAKFIDLTCQAEGDDLSVAISKKSAGTFLEDLKALGRLSSAHIGKLAAAFEHKGSATVVLADEGEQFAVKFWTTDDGRHFMDSLIAEPPSGAGEKGGGDG